MTRPTPEDRAAAEELLAGFPKTIMLEGIEAYCVNCKAKTPMHMPEQIKMRNGKPAIKGNCNKCGGAVFKIGLPNTPEFLQHWLAEYVTPEPEMFGA